MQYRRSMNRANALTAHIAELRTLCTKITPSYGGTGGSHSASDKLGAAVARLVDAENEAAMELDALRKTMCEVDAVIRKVPDERYRNLLYRRYICGETFEEIAVAMHYSWRQIIRLHGNALLAAKDVIECHIGTVV
ncbi:MAG: hypothetical protein MJ062_05585 [Oscillospiraceae bacterium]|nr:hypothetical protein [Oscillospiraceae bacterium]